MKNKSNIILYVIILLLAILCLLLVTGKISFVKTNTDVDYSKLSEYGKGDYNFINNIYNDSYSVLVNLDGKIVINYDKEIKNISNGKDIVLINNTLYILTKDGDLYKYDMDNIDKEVYNANKVNKYSNIDKIFVYKTRKKNAGGCDYLVAVDNNQKYYKIDSLCA